MSIGWVMFGKALVLAIAVAIGERWKAFRLARREAGLPLRKNRQGVYVVFDWTHYVERAAFNLWNGYLLLLAAVTATLLAYGWWTGVFFNY